MTNIRYITSFIWTIVGIILGVNVLYAQDVHLSHIHASPTYLNPAMNGLHQHDVRLITNYRGQWNSFTKGYHSFLASADMKMKEGITENDDLALGIQIVGDQAGDLNFGTLSGTFGASYLKALDRYGEHFISFGVSSGFVQRRLNINNAQFIENDPFVMGGNFVNKQSFWDISAGIGWFYPIDQEGSFSYLGLAIHHLNQAFVSFQARREREDQGTMLHQKLVFHGGGSYKLGEFTTLMPSFIYMNQGPHKEFNVGTYLKLSKENKSYYSSDYALYAGAWYRWSLNNGVFNRDALVGSVRYDLYNHVFALSFDFNVSDLARATQLRGGPELSYIYFIDLDRKKRRKFKVKCPKF